MTSEQYALLLQDLARVAPSGDAASLVEHGRMKLGELDAVLVHNAEYDENLLQVRMRLGTLPERGEELARAILEANFISGFGGECVFSLFPESHDVVFTLRTRLGDHTNAQDLLQSLSDVSRDASQMWRTVVDGVGAGQAAPPADAHPPHYLPGLHAV